MRTARLSLLLLLAAAGCDLLRKPKADNPVAGTPPPRMSLTAEPPGMAALQNPLIPVSADNRTASSIMPLVLSQSPDPPSDLTDSRTAALVNGTPILVSEILEPYKADLARMEQEFADKAATMSPSQRAQAEKQLHDARLFLVQRDLKGHIERKLLVGALREQLKPEQITMLNDLLTSEFEKETERLMKKEGLPTRLELERKLQEQNTSIVGLRDMFFGERLAMEYLGFRSRANVEVGRPDMLRYYERHLDDYAVAAKVKWQQLLVSHSKHGGRQGAQAVLQKAIAELEAGADFDTVVQNYSNGLNAESGGHIGWIEPGSLSDKELERALFELPVGSVSAVFDGRSAFQIVKITDRQPEGRVPFAEVQDEIRTALEKEQRQQLARTLIDELHDAAIIVTIFDQPKAETASR